MYQKRSQYELKKQKMQLKYCGNAFATIPGDLKITHTAHLLTGNSTVSGLCPTSRLFRVTQLISSP